MDQDAGECIYLHFLYKFGESPIVMSAGMSRQLQDGITAKYYTPEKKTLFFKNKYPEPALRLVWKNQKGFLIQTKFGGSSRQF